MRKLTRLWQAIERVSGLLAVPAIWETECGDEFDVLRPYLRPTNHLGSTYPCPYPNGGDCPRKIIDHGGGEYVAICREPHRICPDESLTPKEALLQELDLAAFLAPVLNAASIRAETLQPRGHGVWSIGLSNRRSSLNRPVFLLVFAGAQGFLSAARDLLLDVPGQFVIVAPTNRHRSVDLQTQLQARAVLYLCLEEGVFVDERGRFATVDPLESANKVASTPVADRKRVIKGFTTKYRCKVADVQRAAGVHSSDYYKWLSGAIPDHYSTCIAIEKVLVFGLGRVNTNRKTVIS
jgi:hypothetical protein